MKYSKERFKELWEANSCGSGIAYDDIADCAVAWGISECPRIRPIDDITYRVLKAADVKDAEEYNPNPASQCEGRIMIDLNDACEWLKSHASQYGSLLFLPESDYPQGDVEVESLIKAFKQAMKGGKD